MSTSQNGETHSNILRAWHLTGKNKIKNVINKAMFLELWKLALIIMLINRTILFPHNSVSETDLPDFDLSVVTEFKISF